MSRIQRLMRAILPRKMFAAIEEDSKRWRIVCPCGDSKSYWDIGGLRYKGKGNPRVFFRCLACGRRTWHRVEYADA